MEYKSMYFSTEEADQLRREFYDRILSQSPSGPESDFRRLADAWLHATQSDWVWLWLKNTHLHDSPWELRELACREDDRNQYIFLPLTVRATNTVTAYCSLTNEPETISDIDGWSKTLDGVEYKVRCADKLKQLQCASFVTVPFRSPSHDRQGLAKTGASRLQIEGAVCYHFREGGQIVDHPPESLRLMGQLSAMTIVNAFKTVQQDILFDLNELEYIFLTRVSRKTADDRQNYLLEVIKLLQKYLRIGVASIFYQDGPQFPVVRCLATTGISQNSQEEIPKELWGSITYKPGEGLTGKCFATGEPEVLSAEQARNHLPRYVEFINGQVVGRNDAVLCPIPRSLAGASDTRQPKACGVIRCSDHRTTVCGTVTRPFDPVDLQTLAFIAQQIAPVVETLTVRIRREETISVIKHDLLAPLVMIRDTAEELVEEADNPNNSVRIRYYDLMNLGSASLVAANLVQQLDPEPGKVRLFQPERTLLERSIVARITNLLNHYAQAENQMRIRFAGFREIPPIWVDRDLIERVFVNLLTNAIKYGKSGTTIEMIASVDSAMDSFCIDIKNQGDGIAADEKDLVFERGYRSPSVVSKRQGIGLGLFIARSAIERNGGTLKLTSISNPTIFSIFLPQWLRQRGND